METDDFAGFDVMPEPGALNYLPDPWLMAHWGAAMAGTAILLLIVRELFKDSGLSPDERAVAMM